MEKLTEQEKEIYMKWFINSYDWGNVFSYLLDNINEKALNDIKELTEDLKTIKNR
jgi:hypothetical protein